MTAILQRHHVHRSTTTIREGDLVRLVACVGSYRVRAIDYTTQKAGLARMSGKDAGEWDIAALVPMSGETVR